MLKGVIMYSIFFAVIMANVHEILKVQDERLEAAEQRRSCAKLYVNAKPFERWIEWDPEGEPIQYTLFTAWREGQLMWVLREGGHYVEPDSIDEFTVDRELKFEEGMALLATKRAAIDSTPEWSE